VAHSLSAKKRVRQNLKRNARNRARKEIIKGQTKSFLAAITAGDVKKAAEELNVVVSKLARIGSKSTMHKKTASRKRSRLTLKLNALTKAGSNPAPEAKAAKPKAKAKPKTAGTKAAKA
jgi:small subunit ribosomal protein S20